MAGLEAAPSWLATDDLLASFGKRRADARRRYMKFVADGVGAAPIWQHLNRQVYLGDDTFVGRMQAQGSLSDDVNVPRAQRRPPAPTLARLDAAHSSRDEGMAAAHATGRVQLPADRRAFRRALHDGG